MLESEKMILMNLNQDSLICLQPDAGVVKPEMDSFFE